MGLFLDNPSLFCVLPFVHAQLSVSVQKEQMILLQNQLIGFIISISQ